MLPELQRNNQPQLLKLNLPKLSLLFPHTHPLSLRPKMLQPNYANSKVRAFCTLQIRVDSRIPLLSTLTNTKFLLTFNNNLKQFLPLLLLLSFLDTLPPLSTPPVLLPSIPTTDMVQCPRPTLLLPLLNSTLLITLLHLPPLPSSSHLAPLESRSRHLQETVNPPDPKLKTSSLRTTLPTRSLLNKWSNRTLPSVVSQVPHLPHRLEEEECLYLRLLHR